MTSVFSIKGSISNVLKTTSDMEAVVSVTGEPESLTLALLSSTKSSLQLPTLPSESSLSIQTFLDLAPNDSVCPRQGILHHR